MAEDKSTPPPGPAPGVALGPPKSASIQCPSCGATITLRALGQSVMVVCSACHSHIDVSKPEIRLIQKYREETKRLHIPLGTRGSIEGQKFEVIGALGRSQSGWAWEEYLLFNPYLGFRWLVWDQGHWNFGQALKDTSQIRQDLTTHYQGQSYRLFQQGKTTVDWVVGEFYWRVTAGDTVTANDFIAPPLMLSCERSAQEVTWTLLKYLPPAEVATAFGTTPTAPVTVAPNQPNPAAAAWKDVRKIAIASLFLAVVIQVGTVLRARDTWVPLGEYHFVPSGPGEEQVLGPFTLTANHSLNELTAQASIGNSWIELDCSLVNAATGTSVDFMNAFEFYYGRGSDGPWTEGSQSGTVLLTSVPSGTYNLVVEGSSGDIYGRPIDATVTLGLRHDVAPWRNFLLTLVALLAYPGYLAYRHFTFEKERWSDSGYSPYSKSP